MGLMFVAKPMISDVFTTSMPSLVTASFASSYLLALAGGNLAGRLGWAAVSDRIGRPATFTLFTVGGAGVFLSLPSIISGVVEHSSPALLGLFCLNTVLAVSILGGTLAVLPAYEADIFGPGHV